MPNYTNAGRTQHFAVLYDSSLGMSGAGMARGLLDSCEGDYAKMSAWFGGVEPPNTPIKVQLEVTTTFSGGVNNHVNEVYLFVDAGSSVAPRSTFVNEVAEIFMHSQGKGWDSTNSKGEALSRFLGEEAYPSSQPLAFDVEVWLNSPREDFLKKNDPHENVVASPAIGCALLFLNYLRSQLGFSLNAILTAGGDTLKDVYTNLTTDPSAFEDFRGLLAARFPPGQVFNVESFNPFPLSTGRRLSLSRLLETQESPSPRVRDLVSHANVGNVRALLNTARRQTLL